MSKLRVGIVGLGAMGRQHLRVLGNLEGVEVVGVFDQDSQKLNTVPREQQTNSLDELIAKRLDYCVIATPTNNHESVSMALIEFGIHCFIEKPLALNSESARRIANASEKAGVICGIGQIERYNPALIEARNRILSGHLGDIYQIATRRQGPFPERITDVGVTLDLATHDIDLTSWLVNQHYVSINSQVSFATDGPREDLVVAVGLLSKGVITNHIVNWVSPIKERTTVITGEEGAFVVDTLMADLTFYKNGAINVIRHEVAMFRGMREGDVIRYAIPKPEPLISEHEAFRDAVLGNNPVAIVSPREGVTTIEVAEQIMRGSNSVS